MNNMDMIEDSSPINNHQRDLEIHDDSHLLDDDLVIVWTINEHSQFLLSHDIITCLRSDHSVWTIPSSISFSTSLFTHSVIMHSRDLVTCLQAVSMQYHREGPENIFPSSGWTNPTLDPWASTNTFRVPKSTFTITLLWCDDWYHESTLLVSVINMISWSKD
jgi:hypothetical protein